MPVFSGTAGVAAGLAEKDAAKRAEEIVKRRFDLTRVDVAPFLGLGQDSANFLRALFFGTGPSAGLFQTGGGQVENPEVARLEAALAALPPSEGGTRIGEYFTRDGDRRFGVVPRRQRRVDPFAKQRSDLRNRLKATPRFVQAGSPTGAKDFGEIVREFDPTFAFRQSEGEKAINRALAARGLFGSGRALKALNEFNANLALGSAENFLNRLATFAGLGQTAGLGLGDLGLQTARSRAGFVQDAGAARASAINAGGNALGDLARLGIGLV